MVKVGLIDDGKKKPNPAPESGKNEGDKPTDESGKKKGKEKD